MGDFGMRAYSPMGVAIVCRLLPATAVRGMTCLMDRGVSALWGGARGAVGNGDAGVGRTKYCKGPSGSGSRASRDCFDMLDEARSSTQFHLEGNKCVGYDTPPLLGSNGRTIRWIVTARWSSSAGPFRLSPVGLARENSSTSGPRRKETA
ncbi:hypothetical protein GSI_09869 [Ganoderma sinense ZZ0214-1]|uniref:Uncharacterized protein n=1 Tax=Ganoderma sinense ZZ0214-1 TaxID=1077348 RepID=A0A2G8S394_9APHY|nr:hypothetical protein GSI_09869 [Ganoderma sinense ZZ0214-1]